MMVTSFTKRPDQPPLQHPNTHHPNHHRFFSAHPRRPPNRYPNMTRSFSECRAALAYVSRDSSGIGAFDAALIQRCRGIESYESRGGAQEAGNVVVIIVTLPSLSLVHHHSPGSRIRV